MSLNRWVFKWRLKVRMFSHSRMFATRGSQSLRSSDMDLLTVPRADTSLGLRRFSVAGP